MRNPFPRITLHSGPAVQADTPLSRSRSNGRESGLVRKTVCLFSLGLASAILVGCSSSSSRFHADARFAAMGEDSFATEIEGMEEGDEVVLPMHQEGYVVEGSNHSPRTSRRAANFTLRMEEDGRSLTIETRGDSFTWEPGSVDVGGGILLASDVSGDVSITTLNLLSRYYEYVHFGIWEAVRFDEEHNHERTEGGVFRQGFETERANMPTTGTASYEGGMIGKVFHSGETGFEIDGVFSLFADFESGMVHGLIDTFGQFNNISLEGGSIRRGNQFSGTAVTTQPGGVGSFSAGVEGRYDGAFYGPSADEVGGTWRLQEGDSLAVGAFGGPSQ